MNSTTPVSHLPQTPPVANESVHGFSRSVWWKIIILTGLMFWLYYPESLRRLWEKTNPFTGEANWGHSMIIPLIGIYFLYVNREALYKATIKTVGVFQFDRRRWLGAGGLIGIGLILYYAGKIVGQHSPSLSQAALIASVGGGGLAMWGILVGLLNWGLGTLIFGILLTGYGIWPGQNDYLKDLGLVFAIFGLVLYLCGWEVMKIAWFPIVFLICGIPWPGLVYSWVASPLQVLAAWSAVHVAQISGVDSYLSGTKIFMLSSTGNWHALNVAQACAGMRSLMTFVTVGAAVGFLSDRPLWQKIFITLAAIPIAVFCNVMRVSIQADMDHYISQQLSQGFAHATTGWIILVIPGFLLILGTGWFLDKIFVEEIDEQTAAAAKKKEDELIIRIPRKDSASQSIHAGEGS